MALPLLGAALPALGRLAAPLLGRLAPSVGAGGSRAMSSSAPELSNFVSKSADFNPGAGAAAAARPRTSLLNAAANFMSGGAGKSGVAGQMAQAAIQSHGGGDGNLLSQVAHGVMGGGGPLQKLEGLATGFLKHTPAGMLLRHTPLGGIVKPLVDVMNNPVVNTALGALGPYGRGAAIGADLAANVLEK